jgi:hypothetical protein
MLILTCTAGQVHRRSAHLLDRHSLGPLCGTTLHRPDAWEVAVVRPGTARVCGYCWARRFWVERLW